MTPNNGEWKAGTPILIGTFIGLGTSLHLHFYVSSLFVGGITSEFGWSRGEVAAAQAIAMWGVVAAPFVGRLIDRVGVRYAIIFGQLALAAAYLMLAGLGPELWLYVATLAGLQALGQASGTAAHTRAVASWFERNRGLAMGIAITGIPLFGVIMAPLLSAVIEAYSWRAGYAMLAGVSALVGLPIAAWLVRERPRPTREASKSDAAGPDAEPGADVPAEQPGYEVRDLPRLPVFWLLILALVLVNVPGGGFLGQLAPMLQDGGLTAAQAAWFVSAFAGAVIVGRLMSGALLDRYNPALVAALFTCAPAIGMAAFALTDTLSPAMTLIGVALIGIQQGAEIDLLAFFTARHFGLKRYSTIYGIGYAVVTIATSFGVTLFGLCHDWTGSYHLVLSISAFTFLGAALCFLAIRRAPVVADKPQPSL